jgi:large subunit ribosomal protein L6
MRVEQKDHRVVLVRQKDNQEQAIDLPAAIAVRVEDGKILVERASDSAQHKALHGLTRSLIANAVEGLTNGFQKVLEVYGMGFRVAQQNEKVVMQLGFSHPVEVHPPPGISLRVETFTPTQENNYLSARVFVSGADKILVGQMAAKIRAVKKPEPYKGKGIRYQGEYVRRKAGKAAKATGK